MLSRQSRLTFGALAAATVAAVLALASCRAEHDAEPSTTLSDVDKPWYDSSGAGGTCDAPSKTCSAYEDEKDFVDTCVAKGFQAKTCGCAIRCSGQSGYVKPKTTAAASSLALTDGVSTPSSQCPEDAKTFINQVVAARKPGSSLDRCIDSHVCNGNVGWCSGDERQKTTRLRSLARQHCQQEVLETFCRDGNADSLTCPDEEVANLSRVWSDLTSAQATQRRCLHAFVCSGEKEDCSAADLAHAQSVHNSVAKAGCGYWLQQLCNVSGPKAAN